MQVFTIKGFTVKANSKKEAIKKVQKLIVENRQNKREM